MKKILIVEDEDFGANLFRLKLKQAGYEAKIARDGDEAIKLLESFTPNFIILDLILPIRDGFDVLAEIKQNKKWQSIPVIVTSNLSQKEDIDKAMKLGAKDFVVKSDVTLDEVVKKIKALI